MGGAYGLDFGAVLAMGQAQGADLTLLAAVLPGVERILLDQLTEDKDDGTS